MLSKDSLKNLEQFLLENNINNERIINKIFYLRTNLALGNFK